MAPRFRIGRVPVPLDTVLHGLRPRFHWDHCEDFRLLVLAIAFAWGRRNGAKLYQYLAVPHHRTRFNTFFLVQRWDPEAALRPQAPQRLRTVPPPGGETRDRITDDSQKAKRGQALDAVAKMQDPTLDASIWGHQYVCGLRVFRQHVRPYGLRLYVRQAPCPAVGRPFRKTTAMAAQLVATTCWRQGHGLV